MAAIELGQYIAGGGSNIQGVRRGFQHCRAQERATLASWDDGMLSTGTLVANLITLMPATKAL